jgi:hypothetical protein
MTSHTDPAMATLRPHLRPRSDLPQPAHAVRASSPSMMSPKPRGHADPSLPHRTMDTTPCTMSCQTMTAFCDHGALLRLALKPKHDDATGQATTTTPLPSSNRASVATPNLCVRQDCASPLRHAESAREHRCGVVTRPCSVLDAKPGTSRAMLPSLRAGCHHCTPAALLHHVGGSS